jgi:hypothetical protein
MPDQRERETWSHSRERETEALQGHMDPRFCGGDRLGNRCPKLGHRRYEMQYSAKISVLTASA